jgi:hypothetical protein
MIFGCCGAAAGPQKERAMPGKPITGALVASGAIVVVALGVFTQLHPGATEAGGAPASSSPTSAGPTPADPSSAGPTSADPKSANSASTAPVSTGPAPVGPVSPGAQPPASAATPPPLAPVPARTLARYRELTARAEQLAALITPPNARLQDLASSGPSGGPLPHDGLPESLTYGVGFDRPAGALRTWEVTTNSTSELARWVTSQHLPGAKLVGAVEVQAPDPSPSAGFSQQTITFAVPATPTNLAGAVSVHVFHADATRSGLQVEASLPWTDPDPARTGIDRGQYRYTVRDAAACPTLPGPPAPPTSPLPTMPNFANTGYPTLNRLVPDLAPAGALRCRYTRGSDGVLAATAGATKAYDAAAARSLTDRLSAVPIGQLHAAVDLRTAGAAPMDLLILRYPGRPPVVVTFTGFGVSNGDIVIAVPHVNPVDGSPLWLPGTASLAGILDQIT